MSVTVVDVCIVRPGRSGVNPRWLMHAINAPQFRSAMAPFEKGTTRKRISRSNLALISLPVPPLLEQGRIVAAIEEQFSRLDVGVEALQRVRRNLKRMRAVVLQYAVTGRLVAPTKSATLAIQLAEQLRHEARERGVRKNALPASQYLRSIPDSWQVVALADLAESIDYGTSEKTLPDVEGVPILRMGNLGWGTIGYHNLKFLPREKLDDRLLLKRGDLLFNRTNSAELVGKTAVFQGYPSEIAFASYLIRVRPLPSANLNWASIVLNSTIGRRYVGSVRNQQVGQANVNGTKLAATPIPLPSSEEQSRIMAECDRIFSVIEMLEDATAAIVSRSQHLRSSVLSTAFAGRLAAQDSHDEPASVLLESIAAKQFSNGHKVARGKVSRMKVTA
jgi:type I restriction enzyme S subunit